MSRFFQTPAVDGQSRSGAVSFHPPDPVERFPRSEPVSNGYSPDLLSNSAIASRHLVPAASGIAVAVALRSTILPGVGMFQCVSVWFDAAAPDPVSLSHALEWAARFGAPLTGIRINAATVGPQSCLGDF